MGFKVIKYFKKRSEGLKPYNVGDSIILSAEDAKVLLDAGFVKEEKKPAKSKEQKTVSNRKTK